MSELFQVITLEQAYRLMAQHLPQPQLTVEQVPLTAALGRRLANDVIAEDDLPGFSRSTVDGFAVRAGDTFGASEGLPAYLDLAGEVLMGQAADRPVQPGQAIKISTGGMLPPGADAVVMVEYTEPLDHRTIGVTRSVAPGENVIRRGEDVQAGELIFTRGHRLKAQDLGLLAALGRSTVEVLAPVPVGIISTGDEVVTPETQPGPGQVRDMNSYTLFGLVQMAGGRPKLYGIVPDDFTQLREKLAQALEENQIVLLSGGSSVGTRDVTVQVINALGSPGVLYHGLAIRPGKPTIGAVLNQKPVFGLPGHPVSAMVVFDLVVRPLIDGRMINPALQEGIPVPARITRSLASAAGREDFIRVQLRRELREYLAEPILGKSGLLTTMVRADGLVKIPLDKQGLVAGELVEVWLFE